MVHITARRRWWRSARARILGRVGNGRAIIAGIAHAIAVRVLLVRVGHVRAIVHGVRNAIAVRVSRRRGRLDLEEVIRRRIAVRFGKARVGLRQLRESHYT